MSVCASWKAPPGGAGRGWVLAVSRGCSFCRDDLGDGGAGGGGVDDFLAGGVGGDEGGDGEVVDAPGLPSGGLVDLGDGVVGEQVAVAAGQGQVVADVAGGLGGGHAGHLVADGDPLVEGGEHAELDHAAQGGLADQDGGERGPAVHVVVGEHPDRLQLGVVQQVGLVDDDDRGASSFGGLAGQDVVGLGGEGGGAVLGPPAEAGDDAVVDAPDADGGVADVDDGVPGVVQACEGGAGRDGLAGADLAGDDAEGSFGDGPGDAGGGLGVGGVPVEHRGGQVAAEGHLVEPEVLLHLVDHGRSLLRGPGRPLRRASCCWAAPRSPARAAA